MTGMPAKAPFDEEMTEFLNAVSRQLMGRGEVRAYADVAALGFWLRKSSLKQLEEKHGFRDGNLHLGRGVAFHIAPSNVPVNFAYSLFAGLLMGNCNIVRVPSREFPQTEMIVDAMNAALEGHEGLRPYMALIRYGREKEINDACSSIADVRIIWGGDATIEQIRKSPLPARGTEVAFADRYSFAVIDSDAYMDIEDKRRVASDFYNDTYLSDQNACTSPRLIVWSGSRKEEAKERFWPMLHELVKQKYNFQPVMAVDKLAGLCLAAAEGNNVVMEKTQDNLITRARIKEASPDLIDLRGSCGYFFEYDTDDMLDLKKLCDDKRVQTVGVVGDKKMLAPLIQAGVRGIDRITDIGHTMDFDLIWDGYNLVERMTRTVKFNVI